MRYPYSCGYVCKGKRIEVFRHFSHSLVRRIYKNLRSHYKTAWISHCVPYEVLTARGVQRARRILTKNFNATSPLWKRIKKLAP